MLKMIYLYTLIFGIIGIFLASYIWRKKSRKEKLVCIIGKDCNKVIESKYGKTLGIENTLLGILYYIFVMALSLIFILFPAFFYINMLSTGFLIISASAALFSFYLTLIQLFVIKELCEYCLANAMITITIFIIFLV